MKARIESLQNPPQKVVISNEEIKDVGDNCLAVKKDGKQCTHKRKLGNYCGQHLMCYINELGGNNETNNM